MRNLAVVLAMVTTGMVNAQFTTMKDSERFEFMSEYTASAKDDNSSLSGVKSKTPTGYVLECNGTKTGVLEHDQIVLVINEMIDFLEEFGKDANTPDFDESTVVLDEECSASMECTFNQLLDGKEVLSAWGINTSDGSLYMATFQFTSHVIHFSVDKVM